jgi:2-keto-4-pentenoate hydratase/2-oxohepta-3-ene-1,7-dioic acid hydratase in catechol pathway
VTRELDRDDLTVLAPIPAPATIWALGWSYRAHVAESDTAIEGQEPFFFLKSGRSVIGDGEAIRLPAIAPEAVDFEGEIALVIGAPGFAVDERDALGLIAGVTAANDVSARDVQKGEKEGRLPNVNLAKSFDTFTPMGPALVTLDEAPDLGDLGIRTRVDGEVRQEARTADLIYPIATQISYLSRYTSLRPGDVILTGTPAGVGYPERRFLGAGSIVEVEVEGVGTLSNPVTDGGSK